jgi:hypothetical protein
MRPKNPSLIACSQYTRFYEDPVNAPIHWLALLFMVLSIGTYFTEHKAPQELQAAGVDNAMAQTKLYRSAAGWALVYGKYMTPGPLTLAPLMLFTESEFMLNRANQTHCYFLMGVVIRLMLKMGLHRDPSLIPDMSPYEGEMRRRMWAFATVMDVLMSFHVGLPSMASSIESDTRMPSNLLDEDFDEDSTELPPPRPDSQYTLLSYAVPKCHLCKVFGEVAGYLHRLCPPPYSRVLQLDALLEEAMDKKVPPCMKPRPLELSMTDNPAQIMQRYGVAFLYHKIRCVLHRRYLTEAVFHNEHEFSRRACIQSALALLQLQSEVFEATRDGKLLQAQGWFMSSIALHDFLLAGTIVYVAIKSPHLEEMVKSGACPDGGREQLVRALQRSHLVWTAFARDRVEAAKTADMLEGMLRRLGAWQHGEQSVSTTSPQSLSEAASSSMGMSLGEMFITGM